MFTLSEIEIIMQKRRGEMIALLRDLGLGGAGQNWKEEFDSFLTKKICCLMKSDSVYEGYSFLLRAADIPQSYSETENEKLAKIAANRPEIERRIVRQNYGASGNQYESRFNVSTVEIVPLDSLDSAMYNSELYATKLNYLAKRFGMSYDQKDFIQSFNDLKREVRNLPDFLYTPLQQKSCSEDEFISLMKASRGNTFLVSVSREKVAARPEPSAQYRKFTEEEARYMLDVLERLNDIVRVI